MLDPWFITGFSDGEANFTYSRNGSSFGMYFGIKQREDNVKILEQFYAFFRGIGTLYKSSGARAHGFSRKNPYAYYRVTRIAELSSIVSHFDMYPLQSEKKRAAYQIWREMVIYKEKNYRNARFEIMQGLANKLSALNTKQ